MTPSASLCLCALLFVARQASKQLARVLKNTPSKLEPMVLAVRQRTLVLFVVRSCDFQRFRGNARDDSSCCSCSSILLVRPPYHVVVSARCCCCRFPEPWHPFSCKTKQCLALCMYCSSSSRLCESVQIDVYCCALLLFCCCVMTDFELML